MDDQKQKAIEKTASYYQFYFENKIFKIKDESAKREFLNSLIENRPLFDVFKKEGPEKSSKILDLGCGFGGFISACEKNGYNNAIGAEIDPEVIKIAKLILKDQNRVFLIDEGLLPFQNDSFDIITSSLVIEHTKDPAVFLSEALRVLKPGGKFILIAPNYLFPREGHYQSFWLPWFFPISKSLFKLFLKMQKRNPILLNEINFKITPGYLYKLLSRLNFTTVKDSSLSEFQEKISNPEKISYPNFATFIRKIKKHRFSNYLLRLFLATLKFTKLYNPIILIITK